FILFTSYGRKDDKGRGDLYMSIKNAAGQWLPARNLAFLNSEKLDYCPFVSADRESLFFTSERTGLRKSFPDRPVTMNELVNSFTSAQNGGGDIYWISFETVMQQYQLAQAQRPELKQYNYTDTAKVDMQKLANDIAGNMTTAFGKVSNVISWTNSNFKWTYTDYEKRTVKEIICRQGGNCAEQAMVVRALLKELNVKTRRITEINIQPEKEQRQKNDKKMQKSV
ncbi:MAG: PD40 domain-containing protein, partial [Chitinophagaceae bacterium]|nr:PD40 domain-containing protein [Chitinophagaceae bacterium]